MNAGFVNSRFLCAWCVTLAAALSATSVALPRPAEAEAARPVVESDTTGRGKKSAEPFRLRHVKFERVLGAKVEKRFELKRLFRERGLTYPAHETFIRIFKRERLLEVWVREKDKPEFSLLKSYGICALAGQAGPKREQGDGQTPEGFYYIDGFNPSSDFHLSLHIDYPNRSDQILNPGKSLGGSIFIHGGCQTEGCMAVSDDAIKELYWLAVEATSAGQERIPVHIFPAKLTDQTLFKLVDVFDDSPELRRFWANLKPTFDYFETSHRLPSVTIDERGRYRMKPIEVLGTPVVTSDSTQGKVKG